jgi:membrane carboxypeptidase/penicillin-binding protein
MGALKQIFATLGLFLFLCPVVAVHAQEKMATYPPFAPGYISIKVFDNQSRFVGRLLPERRYWVSIDQIPVFLQNAVVAIEDSRFTIRLDKDTVQYFKGLAKNTGMSYQNLINLYLRDCVETKKEPRIQWSQPK